MSILIAEDNVAQRAYLREILERDFPAHQPILEAGDGEDTVVLALKHKPAVCILDIQMPKLSGVKAARAIWRDFPTARIIFWTQFPHEIYIKALYYLALGLSNWAIARKCSLSLRGVESRLATLYEKLFVSLPEGTPHEAYEKLAYNVRTRAFFEALRRGLLNNDELEKAAVELEGWLERDQKKFLEEQKREARKR